MNDPIARKTGVIVSVYLPTKNRVGLLRKAIGSVLAQTYREFELVVVNDGSNDGTRDYLDDLCRQDARVTAIHHPVSLGSPRSRNEAIESCSGRFLTGLDDDDSFYPNRIQAFLDYWHLLTESNQDFSCIYSQDTIRRGGIQIDSEKPGSATYEKLFRSNIVGNQVFAPRELYLDVGGFDEEMPAWQDLDLFMRMLRRRGPARLLDAATYVFDDEPRLDRISIGSRGRIFKAYQRLASKNSDVSPPLKQALFLQIFSRFYGIRPGWKDAIEFMRYGFDSKNFASLCKAFARTI